MKSHRNFENFKVSDAVCVCLKVTCTKVCVLCLLSYFSSDFIGQSASGSACLPIPVIKVQRRFNTANTQGKLAVTNCCMSHEG